jgi:Flp pilus assembly protein TadB
MRKRIVRSEQSLVKIFGLAGLILTGVWLMTGLFIPSPLPRTIAGFLASLLLTRSLRRWFKNRHLLHCREQYRGLLEHLLSRLSAGWTLERAFMDAPISLSRQVGEKTG